MFTVSLCLKLAIFSPIEGQISSVVTVSAIFVCYHLSSLASLTEQQAPAPQRIYLIS